MDCPSAVHQVFNTPELLELILLYLPTHQLQLTDQEDPRSTRTLYNSRIISYLLRCSQVARCWHACVYGSILLKRHLFLAPPSRSTLEASSRSWSIDETTVISNSNNTYRNPSLCAPILNPVIQTTFPSYHFRFWHLPASATGNRHCAYLILTRRDMERMKRRTPPTAVTKMLLSEPPCVAVDAMIWEERDESRDYVGRTLELEEPMIREESGLTLDVVHARVQAWFDKYADVHSIKLTTS